MNKNDKENNNNLKNNKILTLKEEGYKNLLKKSNKITDLIKK